MWPNKSSNGNMMLTRREVFAALCAAGVARGSEEAISVSGKRSLIRHNDRREDLETPVQLLDSWLTPTDTFYVRQHLPRPAKIDGAAYRLSVNGMVSKPVELTLAELERLPQVTVPATLE